MNGWVLRLPTPGGTRPSFKASDRGQKHFFASKIVLRVIVCCFCGVSSTSSSRRMPRFIVLFSSGHRWLFFRVASRGLCRRCVIFRSSCRRVFLSSTALHTWQVLDEWGHILYRLYLHKLYLPFFALYLVALLPCYLVTLLLCYLVIPFPCYYDTSLLWNSICNSVTLVPTLHA